MPRDDNSVSWDEFELGINEIAVVHAQRQVAVGHTRVSSKAPKRHQPPAVRAIERLAKRLPDQPWAKDVEEALVGLLAHVLEGGEAVSKAQEDHAEREAMQEAVTVLKEAQAAPEALMRRHAAERDALVKAVEVAKAASAKLAENHRAAAEAIIKLAKRDADIQPHGEQGPDLVPRAFTGAYEAGRSYRRGDLVVFLGSTWIATRDTTDRPAASSDDPDWQLFAAAGMGGGFSDPSQFRGAGAPPDDELYGQRGGQVAGFYRAERFITEWQPDIIYYLGDKVLRADANGLPEIWRSLSRRRSNPVWDAAEEAEWERISGSVPPFTASDTPPIPPVPGYFWLNTVAWTLHVAVVDTNDNPIWAEITNKRLEI